MRALIILDLELDESGDVDQLHRAARAAAVAITEHKPGALQVPLRLCHTEARDAVLKAFDETPSVEKRSKV
jgi:hypothetical protein